ncbi:MAG: glycosyltransferase [Ferruginibacter sp.]
MYIVHVGNPYFPEGNAAVQRMRITYRALKEAGFSTLIINKESYRKEPDLKRANRFEGIPFVFTSTSLTKPKLWIAFRWNRLSGVLGELNLLFKRRKTIGAIILYNTSSFTELLYYRLVSWLMGFKLVFQYVEYRSSIRVASPARRISNYLFDSYCSYFADGAIVISEFLRNVILKRNSKLPVVKLPAICNFNEFTSIPALDTPYPYFLYCGTAEYLPVITFILELYEKIREKNLYNGYLKLVVGANNPQSLVLIREMIDKCKYGNNIILLSGIPYTQLIASYKSADLLLIPLRNTLQDLARFPHKISEYTASKRPLISTNIGEPQYYFKNGTSAILAEAYTIDSYIESLAKILPDMGSLDKIGYNGYEVGINNFHYQSNIEALRIFFEKLCGKKADKAIALEVAV